MHRSTLAKRLWQLFFLAIVAVYFYGLGRPPLLGPDEPRYAQVAREMFIRGDFITPTLGGHTWFEKPSLLYWMMMASYRVFGVTEFAARFGPACAGLLTVLIIFWMGHRVERSIEVSDKPTDLGRWSSLALATSVGLIIFSRAASVDIVVTMTVTLALACFFISEIELNTKRRVWLLAGFYAAVGASLLAKGLVGLVIPFGVVGVYCLFQRSLPDRRVLLSLLWGVPLAILVASLWYAPVITRHGSVFIDEFFIQHHFARYVSNKYHHPEPFYFFLPIMCLLVFPWTPFLISAFSEVKPSVLRKRDPLSKARAFAFAWLIVPVAFFSLSGSKLPGYVLPALPGAAFLVGDRLVKFLRGDRDKLAMRITGGLLICLAIAGAIYVDRTHLISNICLVMIATPMVIAGVFILALTEKRRACVVMIICAVLSSTLFAVSCVSDRVGERESVRHLLQIAESRGYVDTPVYGLHTIEYTAEFYAPGRFAHDPDGKPVRFEGPQEVLALAKRLNSPVLIIVPVEYVDQLTNYSPVTADVIGDNGSVALVLVRAR